MKFGQALYKLQEPSWRHAYINYGRLKVLAKTAAADGSTTHLFREVITEDQATVTAFAVDQLVQIQDYVSAELEYAGLSQTGPLTPSLSSKAHAQLLQHGEALREDADQLARLQLYLRVNDEAVRRLQQKVDRLPAVFAGLDLSSDWRAETAPLRTALASLLAATNCAAASISAALRAGTPKTSGLASQAATLQEQRRPVRYDTPDQPPGTPAGGPPPLHLAVMAAEVKGDGDDGCDVLRRLLAASPRAVDEVDAGAGAADRTPLAIAAIYGRERAAKVLLDAGADTRLQDRFGWTALENAAYRGFPKIVELIQAADARAGKKEGGQVARAHSPAVAAMLRALDAPELDISAGHIFVYPGTLDLNRDVEAVDVAPYRARIAPGVLPDTSLRLAVTATNCGGQRYETDLPLLGDAWTDPWHFTARDVDQAALSFELSALATVAQSLHPAGDDTTAKSGDATGAETLQFERIATAITTLGALRQTSGVLPGFESLVRDHTLPLVGTDGCLVGTVAFSVVATTPMPAAAPPPPFPPQRLDRPAKTLVVGHRGAGQNTPQRYLQLGENTVESFRAAVGHDKLAAAGVEFDVQLTKDFHPVVYHDFLVAETGADTPVHNLTLAQFLAVNDRQKATGPGGVAQTPSMPSDLMARPNETGRRRAHSLGGTVETDTETLIRGMQRTFPYRGFKANLRTEQIHQPFATFEEVLKGLPEDIVFDVEIKYPMLYEAQYFCMQPHAVELNRLIDTILSTIFRVIASSSSPTTRCRRLVFSSFSPEVCAALACKQRTFPVLFLSDSNNWPTPDARALSLQAALRFAKRWRLAGVVLHCNPFVAAPRLVRLTADAGLVSSTYGAGNDDPVQAKIQAAAGLDIIIVNRVRLIREALEADANGQS